MIWLPVGGSLVFMCWLELFLKGSNPISALSSRVMQNRLLAVLGIPAKWECISGGVT